MLTWATIERWHFGWHAAYALLTQYRRKLANDDEQITLRGISLPLIVAAVNNISSQRRRTHVNGETDNSAVLTSCRAYAPSSPSFGAPRLRLLPACCTHRCTAPHLRPLLPPPPLAYHRTHVFLYGTPRISARASRLAAIHFRHALACCSAAARLRAANHSSISRSRITAYKQRGGGA